MCAYSFQVAIKTLRNIDTSILVYTKDMYVNRAKCPTYTFFVVLTHNCFVKCFVYRKKTSLIPKFKYSAHLSSLWTSEAEAMLADTNLYLIGVMKCTSCWILKLLSHTK